MNKTEKLKFILSMTIKQIKTNAAFTVALLSRACGAITFVPNKIYGTLVVHDCFEEQGKSPIKATNHLSFLFLLDNSITILVIVTLG